MGYRDIRLEWLLNDYLLIATTSYLSLLLPSMVGRHSRGGNGGEGHNGPPVHHPNQVLPLDLGSYTAGPMLGGYLRGTNTRQLHV